MKTKLFSKLLLLVTSFTLISCSFSSSGSGLKGNEDDYYKIDFYSDYADKYFMLASTNETDNSLMFYLLKK